MNNLSENRMFAARMTDLAHRAERGTVCYSDFLTPTERSQLLCMKELSSYCRITFDGGYEDAERIRARFSPIDFDYDDESPIIGIKITCRMGELNHRDVLGSVLGLGISRGKIGDILVTEKSCTVICDKEISSYIINNLEQVGRNSVKTSETEIKNIVIPEKKKITVSVMSLRLDAVASEGFSISRTQVAELIRSGVCFVNWVNIDTPSHAIKQGDIITLRGKGRITVSAVGGMSRKGRTFIELSV